VPGVYISYPFCGQKCTYCNFASGIGRVEVERDYLEALKNEILAAEWKWTPETVYLGGGTPSRLDPEILSRILRLISGRPWREATIEAAPGDITFEKVLGWRASGITRVSLGVQSFIDRELRQTGRRHNAEIVERDVKALREAGIEEINIDLIAGLPFQTPESWSASLDWIERLAPPHVSVYMLEVDEDSRLGQEILRHGGRFGAARVPSEELTAQLYETAVDRLAVIGIARYEISNFARPGHESLHNLKYWRLEPYLGFGSDAHSYDGSKRWWNVEQAPDYSVAPRKQIEDAQEDERFFVGLRLTAGIELSEQEWTRWATPISRHLDSGLLERDGAAIRLSRRGVLLSNEVFQDFLS